MSDTLQELPPGWLSDEEAEHLAAVASGKIVLEIGSFLGRSTVAMARVAELVVSIDHHRGSIEHQPGGWAHCDAVLDQRDASRIDTAPEFLANLAAHGVRNRVLSIIGDAPTARRFLANDRFDLAFVDASHDSESVMHDGEMAIRLTRPGGYVYFHDAGYADVYHAILALTERWSATLGFYPGSLAALRVSVKTLPL